MKEIGYLISIKNLRNLNIKRYILQNEQNADFVHMTMYFGGKIIVGAGDLVVGHLHVTQKVVDMIPTPAHSPIFLKVYLPCGS